MCQQQQYVATWTAEEGWKGSLRPYGPLELLPSAQVLNYGQSIFEGMKVLTNPLPPSFVAPNLPPFRL